MTALEITGGRGARYLLTPQPFILQVSLAARKVAAVPKITSGRGAPVSRFASRHPRVSPGTAAGKNQGRTQSASETRH